MASRGIAPQIIENTRIVKTIQIIAHLAIIGGHSINGVAKLHTELLKDTLRDFMLSIQKFNNKQMELSSAAGCKLRMSLVSWDW